MSFSFHQMIGGGDENDGQQNTPQYTMPKILDYLQSEWFKYEIDRSHWVSEKAELMSRINQLESEKRTQETLRNDLFRRIKMLEYALHQERLKNQPNLLLNKETYEENQPQTTTNQQQQPRSYGKKSSKVSITRNLIKKYLREMNYNDILVSKPDYSNLTIAQENGDIQEEKQTTILNLPDMKKQVDNNSNQQINSSNNDINNLMFNSTIQDLEKSMIGGNNQPSSTQTTGDSYSLSDLTNSLDSLSSALGSLDSLSNGGSAGGSFDFSGIDLQQQLDQLKEKESSSNVRSTGDNSNLTSSVINLSHKQENGSTSSYNTNTVVGNPNNQPQPDEQFESMNEDFFNKLSSNSKGRMKIKGLKLGDMSGSSGSSAGKSSSSKQSTTPVGSIGKKKGLAAELMDLGAADLNDIKLEDNNKVQNDSAAPRVWRYKHSLKSHFDGVRSLQFHPTESLLVSASEDHTIKIWNLNHLAISSSSATNKKMSPADVEPIYTFRGHMGPVYTTALSSDGSELYSAGYDKVIKRWAVPPSDTDQYQTHGDLQSFLDCEYAGHTDGVWDLLVLGDRLMSASSDATVRLWDDNGQEIGQLAHPNSYNLISTTLSLIPTDSNRVLVGYVDGTVLLYDLNTGQNISTLSSVNNNSTGAGQINKVVAHSMLPLAITGSEDNKIEFWDLQSCQPVHSMIAHSDAVTSLTIDPSGLYVASSSHDSTIRFWDISSKTCIQDLQSHRPKFNESIHAIKYHPTKGYFASGGADSVIRIHQ